FGNALEVIPTINPSDSFDFVFVDGEKRSYWDFWEAILPRLSEGALVVFDDVISFPHKTKPFLEKIKNVPGFDQVILPIDGNDGILLLTRI
ncbi:class I SAM-dependent methyltransferase, partial [Candidatus Pacearchaeota archaeon]|nr:class I SAM-dependent methyltransferase [Candidatus Pacearchaeota archaeon]